MSAELSAPAHVTAVSPLGRAFIVAWEGGYRLDAYQCSAGHWTISAGLTRYPHGGRVAKGDHLTPTDARVMFSDVLAHFEADVDAITRDDISQRQFDALVSFAWNLGVKALETSTLLKYVNERHPAPEVLQQFGRWVYADVDPDHPGLEKVPGLIRRRRAEAIVYDHGLYEGPDGQLVTAEERKQ